MQNSKREPMRRFRDRYSMRSLFERRELIILKGDSHATLYGCRRILLYSPCEIRLCIGRCEVSLLGEELLCTCFSAGSITVEGQIRALHYHMAQKAEEMHP